MPEEGKIHHSEYASWLLYVTKSVETLKRSQKLFIEYTSQLHGNFERDSSLLKGHVYLEGLESENSLYFVVDLTKCVVNAKVQK